MRTFIVIVELAVVDAVQLIANQSGPIPISLTTEEIVPVAIVALAFLGIGYTFFRNVLAGGGGLFGMPVPPGPNPGFLDTGGTLPLMNWAVGMKVIAGLGSVVLLLGLFGGGDDR